MKSVSRRVILTTLALVALPVLFGCGSPAPAAVPPPPLTLTESSFGQAVTARVGQRIDVQLTDRRPIPGSSLVWTVSSTDPALLELTSSEHEAAAPARDSAYRASFVARRAGNVRIHATGVTTCEAMLKSACPDRVAEVVVNIS